MLDISTLTIPLTNILNNALPFTVERGVRVNTDPARCPWAGVYPGDVDSVPAAMGGRQWRDTVMLQIVVQSSSFSGDGQSASDALEDIIKRVIDATNADLSLGVDGCRITQISREYRYVVFDDDGLGELFMPQAIIKLKVESRTN